MRHYYDGMMYAITVEPLSEDMIETISSQIIEGSKVMDICCGTGALAIRLAERCGSVTGVDHARGMVRYADRRRQKLGIENVRFMHADAANLDFKDKEFDYAIFSMAIHEMPRDTGVSALKEAKRIAQQVIIGDYAVPQPFSSSRLLLRYLEVAAGVSHLRGYLKYNRHEGLDALLDEAGLEKIVDIPVAQGAVRIVRAKAAQDTTAAS